GWAGASLAANVPMRTVKMEERMTTSRSLPQEHPDIPVPHRPGLVLLLSRLRAGDLVLEPRHAGAQVGEFSFVHQLVGRARLILGGAKRPVRGRPLRAELRQPTPRFLLLGLFLQRLRRLAFEVGVDVADQ